MNASKIEVAVVFLGKLSHERVEEELRQARCFVQHSVIADSGNREGTPVAILEACMAGLPVVSTRHQGIAEVIREGETGYLVDERDINSMSAHMLTLAENPLQAGRLLEVLRASMRWLILTRKRVLPVFGRSLNRAPKKRLYGLSPIVQHSATESITVATRHSRSSSFGTPDTRLVHQTFVQGNSQYYEKLFKLGHWSGHSQPRSKA